MGRFLPTTFKENVMKVYVRASTQSDVDHLATNLRPEDTEEVLA